MAARTHTSWLGDSKRMKENPLIKRALTKANCQLQKPKQPKSPLKNKMMMTKKKKQEKVKKN
jgi:hypothetical protein